MIEVIKPTRSEEDGSTSQGGKIVVEFEGREVVLSCQEILQQCP